MITIDADSPHPPFRQVRDQIAAARTEGTLQSGHRLPPVRTLADQLGLAPNTIARAYRELEAAGVIQTKGRRGSFVAPGGGSPKKTARSLATMYLDQILELGLEPEDAVRALRKAIKTRKA